MAANTAPLYTLTPNLSSATVAAANTARDGSGTLVTLFTAGTNGSRLDMIKFTSAQLSAAASSTMVVRVFVTDNAGANPRLILESVMTTLTPSTTVIGSVVVLDLMNGTTLNNTTVTQNNFYGGLNLASGQIVKVTQSIFAGVQDQNHVFAKGGDY